MYFYKGMSNVDLLDIAFFDKKNYLIKYFYNSDLLGKFINVKIPNNINRI